MDLSKIDMQNLYPEPYCVMNNCLCMKQYVKGQAEPNLKLLCNFVPFIDTQIFVDNGQEKTSRLKISGIAETGEILPSVEVSGDEFASLTWITKRWSFDCNLSPGAATRDNVRFAIQSTSKFADSVSVYSVTGWKQIGDNYYFLMPGDEKTIVELPPKMSGYKMTRSFTEEDIGTAFSLFESKLANEEIIYPLFSFVFLSPLTSFLREVGCEPKTVLMLIGKTGSKKSTLAALMLSFFGSFTSSTLPLSFKDTAKSILYHSFSLKDVLTCIDDFHPTGRGDVFNMTQTAQTIFRSYGDRVGRGRLNISSEPMETRYPQGNAIVTAEFPPDVGESGTARYFAVEMNTDSLDDNLLSAYQSKAEDGVLNSCMYAFTEWIRSEYLSDDNLKEEWLKSLRERCNGYRSEMIKRLRTSGIKCHARIPEDVAVIKIGFEMFLQFMKSHQVIDDDLSELYLLEFDDVMFGIASRQCRSVEEDKPTHVFVCKMNSLLESGRFYLSPRAMGVVTGDAKCLGYLDEDNYYFYRTQSHQAVKKLCDEQGEMFSIPEKALVKALSDENIIVRDKNQFTQGVHVGNKTVRLLVAPITKFNEIVERGA